MSSKKTSDSSKREVNVSGMSFLRGSQSYVWCTTSVLGKGATGAVYQGVNRHTGEPVAVKTFNSLSHMRPQEVQMREFEVLQKVNHENIVKLLAIEEEQEGRGSKVIIMELCTGGSLFNILDDPENSHGLEESEFLLVLKHLAAGMNHLRDNNLVHRDLKPGNIMKFIDVDGSTIYKLTDFGAARELQDDQQFMSLYGTEEYLHPDMYERAVLRKPVGKSFGARVDLWSIGVTLYHVATGQLPFRPYGGRRNRETMHAITTEKSPGVISGVQTQENGPIEWSKELPATCQLSKGLCKLVTPLLGGLLEADPQRMWNFETFFLEVIKLLSRRIIHVFYVNHVQPIVIYFDNEHKYEQFQSLICDQTDLVPANQLLLFDNKPLINMVSDDLPGKCYPVTNLNSPIVLFSKHDDDVTLCIPEVPALKFPTFSSMVSVEHDAAVGKSICSVGYAVKRRIEYFCRCISLIEHSILIFVEVIVQQLRDLYNELGHLEELTSAVSDRFGQLVANHRRFLTILQILNNGSESLTHSLREKLEDLVNYKVEDEKAVRDSLGSLSPIVQQLFSRVVTNGKLRRQWQPPSGSDATSVKRLPNTAATYITKLRESWQHLLRDRAARNLTFNDEQFHLLEKMKMKETAKCLENNLSALTTGLHHATEHLADWCKIAKVQRVQTEIEEADLLKHKNLLENFQLTLAVTEDSYHHTLSDLLGVVKDQRFQDDQLQVFNVEGTNEPERNESRISTTSFKSHKEDANRARVRLSLKQLYEAQEEVVGIIKENSLIIRQFQELAKDAAAKH